jgi:hypothetical protein
MQVTVSISARSGSPAPIEVHRRDSTRSTIALASSLAAALLAGALFADALFAGAWYAGALLVAALFAVALFAGALPEGALRRGLVFLLTAPSYGPPRTLRRQLHRDAADDPSRRNSVSSASMR